MRKVGTRSQRQAPRITSGSSSSNAPALGRRWQPTKPAFPDRRGGHLDRHAIARHVIAPAVERADELRADQGLPPIGQHVTPHTLRYTITP